MYQEIISNLAGKFRLAYVKEQNQKSLVDFLRDRISPSSGNVTTEVNEWLNRNDDFVPVGYNSFADLSIDSGKVGETVTDLNAPEWRYLIYDINQVNEIWFMSCRPDQFWHWLRKDEQTLHRAKYVLV